MSTFPKHLYHSKEKILYETESLKSTGREEENKESSSSSSDEEEAEEDDASESDAEKEAGNTQNSFFFALLYSEGGFHECTIFLQVFQKLYCVSY